MELLLVLAALTALFFAYKDRFLTPAQSENLDLLTARYTAVLKKHFFPATGSFSEAVDGEATNEIETELTSELAVATQAVEASQSAESISGQIAANFSPSVNGSPDATLAIPEDSILKRHYYAQSKALNESITHPYPTDSVLRRHYDSLRAIVLDLPQLTLGQNKPCQQIAVKSYKTQLPEDSVLKRHFMLHLRTTVESEHPYRPSCSILKRHHDAIVESKINQKLAGVCE